MLCKMFDKLICWSILILTIFAVVTQQELLDILRSKKCHEAYYWSSNLYSGRRCCMGENFNYLHLKDYHEECSVPPKDDSLTLPESTWIAFECLVSKHLSKPLTLSNFGQVMTKNMSEIAKNEILSKLKEQDDGTEVPIGKSEKERWELVHDIWTKYFQVEFEVCHTNNTIPLSIFHGTTISQSLYWNPSTTCRNVTYPNIPSTTRLVNSSKVIECQKSLFEKHSSKNYSDAEKYAVESMCRHKELELVKLDELYENDFDFKVIAKKMMTNYWSNSVKETGLKMMFRRSWFFFDYHDSNGTNADNYEDNINRMREEAQTKVWSYNGGYAEIEQLFTNIFMLKELHMNQWLLRYYLCRGHDIY